MKASQATVATRVKTNRQGHGVPPGPRGVISQVTDCNLLVA